MMLQSPGGEFRAVHLSPLMAAARDVLYTASCSAQEHPTAACEQQLMGLEGITGTPPRDMSSRAADVLGVSEIGFLVSQVCMLVCWGVPADGGLQLRELNGQSTATEDELLQQVHAVLCE